MSTDASTRLGFEPLVSPIADAWCVIDPQGNVEISSEWKTEDDAWRVRLGWPTHGEVKDAKASGWRCERVSIISVA